jgi:hypothetical protein
MGENMVYIQFTAITRLENPKTRIKKAECAVNLASLCHMRIKKKDEKNIKRCRRMDTNLEMVMKNDSHYSQFTSQQPPLFTNVTARLLSYFQVGEQVWLHRIMQ